MKDITILLSACGSPSAPSMLSCLRNNGERNIKIIGIDMVFEPSISYMVDEFYKVPVATASDYCDVVLDICKREKVDIYFPTISAEVSAVVERKSDFDELNVKLSVSNIESVNISNNKLHTYQLLESVNIPVPKFYAVRSVNDFVEGCKYMGYPEIPVCLKIVDGSGSRGVRIIDANKSRYSIFAYEKPNSFFTSYDEMLSVLKEVDVIDEMMLVEYMPGNEYTVDLLSDKGEVLYAVGRENTISLMSIAQESILTYDEVGYSIARKIVSLLDMDGNIGFDFMRNKRGTPVLMDINPRLTATVSVIAAGGVNLPYLRIKQLLGEKMPNCTVDYGTRLKRRYAEFFTNSRGEKINY